MVKDRFYGSLFVEINYFNKIIISAIFLRSLLIDNISGANKSKTKGPAIIPSNSKPINDGILIFSKRKLINKLRIIIPARLKAIPIT